MSDWYPEVLKLRGRIKELEEYITEYQKRELDMNALNAELEAKLAECEVVIKELALEATTAEDQLELAEMKLAEVAEKCIKVHKMA